MGVISRESEQRPSPTPSSSTDDETENTQPEQDYDIVQEFVPIRFLENRIRTLSRTSVPHNLSRLQQHRENMVRFHREKNWEKLNGEQLNASRTVQVRILKLIFFFFPNLRSKITLGIFNIGNSKF